MKIKTLTANCYHINVRIYYYTIVCAHTFVIDC